MSVAAFMVRPLYSGFIAGGLVQGATSEPETFSFGASTGVALSALNETSITVAITGLTITADVTLSGDGSAEYSKNGGAFATAPTTCVEGDTFALRVDASASYSTSVLATLTINGVAASFTVTTLADPSAVVIRARTLFRSRSRR